MANLQTNYLGLSLKNPIIAGSSGLCSTPMQIKRLEEAGVGAVVLKSIFEEEIAREYELTISNYNRSHENYEYYDYFDYKIKEQNLAKYTKLIYDAKRDTKIPIIASINAVTPAEWASFAKKFEDSGADALEINAFILPTQLHKTSSELEKQYTDIIANVLNYVSIPVALKIGPYFSSLANVIETFSKSGVKGLVLFNRTFNPDIDIDDLKLVSAKIFSSDWEYLLPLRWTALMSGRIGVDISASTGIHSYVEVLKLLLAGAKTTQVVTALYKQGLSVIPKMLSELSTWMDEKGFETIDDFRGKANNSSVSEPEFLERVQFMKYFGDREDIV